MTGRNAFQYHTGTMTRNSPSLEREAMYPYVEINPSDAQKESVKGGDMVTISTRRGQIRLRARVTDAVCEGQIFIPFHYREAPANILTSEELDPEVKIPELKVCAAKIKRGQSRGVRSCNNTFLNSF
ncbi:MAG: molybdopterin dinucleotide binding domain-containing protein [Actinomycetota bacterium]|nr:molybdopterin dinucleotide binding domain-containing protein [Actinomycetota bacterium]